MSRTKHHNHAVNLPFDVIEFVTLESLAGSCAAINDFPKFMDELFRFEDEKTIFIEIPLGCIPISHNFGNLKTQDSCDRFDTLMTADLHDIIYRLTKLFQSIYPDIVFDDLVRFMVWTQRPNIVARYGDWIGEGMEWIPQIRKLKKIDWDDLFGETANYTFRRYYSYSVENRYGDALVKRSSYVESKSGDNIQNLIGEWKEEGWELEFTRRPVAGRKSEYTALVLRKVKEQ